MPVRRQPDRDHLRQLHVRHDRHAQLRALSGTQVHGRHAADQSGFRRLGRASFGAEGITIREEAEIADGIARAFAVKTKPVVVHCLTSAIQMSAWRRYTPDARRCPDAHRADPRAEAFDPADRGRVRAAVARRRGWPICWTIRLSADLARDGALTPAMTERFLTLARYAEPAAPTASCSPAPRSAPASRPARANWRRCRC